MKKYIRVLIYLGLSVTKTQSAAFQDLDFDSANTGNLISDPTGADFNPPYQNVGSGSPTDLIPGWQVLLGTTPYPDYYWLNLNSIGGALVSIYDKNNYLYIPQVHAPVQGKFSFALWPGSGIPPLSLIQTGDLPGDAQTIHFSSFGAGVQLFVNGSLIPLTYTYGPPTISANTRLASVEGDISAFAGQTVELKFTSLPLSGTGANLNGLDSIYFAPVPEPGIFVFWGFGVAFVGVCRWSQKRRA